MTLTVPHCFYKEWQKGMLCQRDSKLGIMYFISQKIVKGRMWLPVRKQFPCILFFPEEGGGGGGRKGEGEEERYPPTRMTCLHRSFQFLSVMSNCYFVRRLPPPSFWKKRLITILCLWFLSSLSSWGCRRHTCCSRHRWLVDRWALESSSWGNQIIHWGFS